VNKFCLFFVGFYLPVVIWFDLEEEIVAGGRPLASLWFFIVLALQPSFHSVGCFIRIGLFTEFLCILHRLVWPWIYIYMDKVFLQTGLKEFSSI
jgi:hypothetical protein